MKHNQHHAEYLLEKGKNVRLSETERTEMKSALLSYAAFHTAKEPAPAPAFLLSSVWVRGMVASAFALIICTGTGYAAAGSLPGELLYPIKTNVLEEITAATKISPQAQLVYHHERFELRLGELRTLTDQQLLHPEALDDVQGEFDELSAAVNTLMEDEALDSAVALPLIGDMVAMSTAAEVMVRRTSDKKQAAGLETVTDDLAQVHAEEVTELLESGTTTVEMYIQDQLSAVSAELRDNDLELDTTTRVAEFLEDAELFLERDQYGEVITSVSRAQQILKSEEYSTEPRDNVDES